MARAIGHALGLAAALGHLLAVASAAGAGVALPHSSAALAALRTRVRRAERPILTGCLQECGYKHNVCITMCEACVEKHRCTALRGESKTFFDKKAKKCDVCLKQTQKLRKWSQKSQANTIDSGGPPLLHDSYAQRLYAAEVDFADERRQLQKATDSVLEAQREVEWSAQERREERKRLDIAKVQLKAAQKKVGKWDAKHRGEMTVQEMAKSKHWRKVKQLKHQIRRAEAELEENEDELHEARRKRRFNHTDVDTLEEKEWEQRRKVEVLERDLKDELDQKAKDKADAGWVASELREDVEADWRRVHRRKNQVRLGKQLQEMAEHHLKMSQTKYLKADAVRMKKEKEISRLRTQLANHPLHDFEYPTEPPAPRSDAAPRGALWRACGLVAVLVGAWGPAARQLL